MSTKTLLLSIVMATSMLTACGGTQSSSSSSKPTELVITEHPKDVVAKCPEGCQFSVDVNDESLVKSYMWQCLIGEKEDDGDDDDDGPFGLNEKIEVWQDLSESITGHEKTYIKPSTGYGYHEHKYRCVITDINGVEHYSNAANLSYSNKDEDLPVLYLGNYALKIGETLDVATTGYGSGSIQFVSRNEVTLNNLKFTCDNPIADVYECGAVGFFMYDPNYDSSPFKVNLIGDNIIQNTCWQPEENSGGIGMNFFFRRAGRETTVTITGEGTLSIFGGTHSIYCPGTLVLESDVIMNAYANHYGAGIYTHNLVMQKGATLKGNTNAAVIQTKTYTEDNQLIYGYITIKDNSIVDVCVDPQHVSVGGTYTQALYAHGGLTIQDSIVNISMHINAEHFNEKHTLMGASLLGSNGVTRIENSTINGTISANKSSYGDYCFHIYGLTLGENSVIDNSNITVNIDSKNIISATGVSADGLTIKNSSLSCITKANGYIYSYISESQTKIINSVLEFKSESYDNTRCLGFMCEKFIIDSSSKFYSETKDGIAFGALLPEPSSTEIGYDPDYVSILVSLGESTVVRPASFKISTGSLLAGTGKYNVFETFYDLNDTSKPVSILIIE